MSRLKKKKHILLLPTVGENEELEALLLLFSSKLQKYKHLALESTDRDIEPDYLIILFL